MKKSFKKLSFFASSIFIFFIHLPFVFAKSIGTSKPVPNISMATRSLVPDNNGSPSISNNINVYDSLDLNSLELTKQAFDYALLGFKTLRSMGKLMNDSVISIIDFSLSSAKKRLFVIDIKHCKVLFNTYVAHGKNSGTEYAREFSNNPRSKKSSLGFYVTGDTYRGDNGYSLHLEGEEKGINNNAYNRAIVMHGAPYVNETYIKSNGFIGRSFGCPAVPQNIYKPLIDQIKNGSCLFFYSPNPYYFSHSEILHRLKVI
jgi:hypothetical protein